MCIEHLHGSPYNRLWCYCYSKRLQCHTFCTLFVDVVVALQLKVSMDKCEAEFSSKANGETIPQIEKQLKDITEKKIFIQQATEVVLSQGRKLQNALFTSQICKPSLSQTAHVTTGPINMSSGKFIDSGRCLSARFDNRMVQSTSDLLENSPVQDDAELNQGALIRGMSTSKISPNTRNDSVSTSDLSSSSTQTQVQIRLVSCDNLNTEVNCATSLNHLQPRENSTPSVPKLLMSPRRSSGSKMSSKSVTNLSFGDQNHLVVATFLKEMRSRLNLLVLLWERRKNRLDEARKAVEFTEAVPQILEWVESVGVEFLEKYDHFGDSIVEVRKVL